MSSHDRSPLTWKRALGSAALVVYVPQFAALVVGPLSECQHCLGNFMMLFPIVPGMLAGALVQGDSRLDVAIIVTIAIILALSGLLRSTGPRARIALQGLAALLSLASAVAFSHALRM
jgi:hypothetical protein